MTYTSGEKKCDLCLKVMDVPGDANSVNCDGYCWECVKICQEDLEMEEENEDKGPDQRTE